MFEVLLCGTAKINTHYLGAQIQHDHHDTCEIFTVVHAKDIGMHKGKRAYEVPSHHTTFIPFIFRLPTSNKTLNKYTIRYLCILTICPRFSCHCSVYYRTKKL